MDGRNDIRNDTGRHQTCLYNPCTRRALPTSVFSNPVAHTVLLHRILSLCWALEKFALCTKPAQCISLKAIRLRTFQTPLSCVRPISRPERFYQGILGLQAHTSLRASAPVTDSTVVDRWWFGGNMVVGPLSFAFLLPFAIAGKEWRTRRGVWWGLVGLRTVRARCLAALLPLWDSPPNLAAPLLLEGFLCSFWDCLRTPVRL
ncbi:hypothetical protein BDY21DRAFT_113266 [Lineolata rhizophorae]|uniref:Uncharacterized protein n=1 Tax=Lineolata rhizophorae TaxID=578093 RepID=A0A6A6NQZ4_9PEZI|nr:hypothetical protein BDY21DRAFT_113266 [Lineolata rhizophorae]